MPKVTLIEDHYNLYPSEPNDAIIKEIADYVAVYAEIYSAIHNGEELNVVIRNRACANYLKRMRYKYGATEPKLFRSEKQKFPT